MAESLHSPLEQGGHSPLFRGLHALATVSAGLGGAAIFGAALFVTVSVVLRSLGLGGIRGDFELVELVCAACASLFLPLCQITQGHVMVDLFTAWLPGRLQRRMDGLWMLLFAIGWGLVCWRLSHGLFEMLDYGDRTMLLKAPLWWVYVPGVFGTALAALIAVLMALPRLSSAFRVLESG
ncbi:TRAP transporter small permease [Poseidonocella sp. HB161398]|uniref:TRAP transporter small permease n=1 Tax=Poseidonocella sp. HB161398 TaxID=2320855 RepID=UPI00110867C5|nr:TRAP transporter small permease [Poseidonocella sp. HB161398]